MLHNLGLRLPHKPLLLLHPKNPLLGIKVARVGILPTAPLRTVVLNPIPYPSLLGLLKSSLLLHHLKLINILIALILKMLPILTSNLNAIPNLLLTSLSTTVLIRRLSRTVVCMKEHRTNPAGMRSNLRLAPTTMHHLANLQTTIHVLTHATAMDHTTLMIFNKDPHRRKIVCRQFGYKNVG